MSADPMSDLAAKIESALGEHKTLILETMPSPTTWRCVCTIKYDDQLPVDEAHRRHLARDVIAPLVEVHGREAAAVALEAAADDVPWDQYAAERRDVTGWLRDRAAQHRSKP